MIAVSLALAIAAQIPTGDNPELVQRREALDALAKQKPFNVQEVRKAVVANVTFVIAQAEKDALQTANDFDNAARLVQDPMGFYENRRHEYELFLSASIMGHQEAIKFLPTAWDLLQMSTGLGQRLGRIKGPSRSGNSSEEIVKPSPSMSPAYLRELLNDLAKAKDLAKTAKDNSEIQEIRKADQGDRGENFKLENFEEIGRRDEQRRTRILELIAKRVPKTPADFEACSLVLQHGQDFHDYALAHELAVIATLLGHPSSSWLCAATYDRMLLSAGHRQRYGTQGWMDGPAPLDSTGISKKMRSLMRLR